MLQTAFCPSIAIGKEPLCKPLECSSHPLPVGLCSQQLLKTAYHSPTAPLISQLLEKLQLFPFLPALSISLAHHTLTGHCLSLFQSMKN